MTKVFNLKYLIISAVLISVFGIGLYLNVIKLPITKTMLPMYITDFSNNRNLIGASHNVFVGKVIKQSGNKALGASPETQFDVEVILNIKGNLKGRVTVNQFGGYKNGILYLMREGDVVSPTDNSNVNTDKLLKQGETYLFATRYNSEEDWYTVIPHQNGRELISNDNNLIKSQLQKISETNKKVIAFKKAYKNEILLEADIKNNNTRNSYKSLNK